MKRTHFNSFTVMLTAMLLFTGCTEKLSETIPVTTASDEALALYEKGWEASQLAKLDAAIDLYQKALELDEDFFMANYQLTLLHIYYGDKDLSKIAADKAINCSADLSKGEELIKEMLKLFMEDSVAAAADELGEEIISLYPNDPDAYFPLMAHYMFKNDDEKLVDVMKRQEEAGFATGMTYNSLGYAYMRLDKMEEAAAAFDKYIELEPDHANPYDSKGDYFMKMEDYESALKHYKKAFSIDTTFTMSKEKAMKVKAMMEGSMEEGEEKVKEKVEEKEKV